MAGDIPRSASHDATVSANAKYDATVALAALSASNSSSESTANGVPIEEKRSIASASCG
jgi:hypothetical protein